MKNKINRVRSSRAPQPSEYNFLEHISLNLLFKKWWRNLKKLFSVVQFKFHKYTFGAFRSVRLPFFQLSVLAFAIFIFMKKDLHFQIQMKAPLARKATPASYQSTEQLSVAPSLNWSENSTTSKAVLAKEEVEQYIKRFGKISIIEYQKFGIPASVKMAQALLESQAGKNNLAVQNNNHFGAPLQSQTFSSAWESWRAHSLLFSSEAHPYQALLKNGKDYKKWAKGLKELNYSTQNNYDVLLIQLIEQYELFRLDEIEF